jgi:hypothetical protein
MTAPDVPKRSARPLYISLTVWATCAFLYSAYEEEIGEALWLMAALPFLALLVAAAGFILWSLFALFRDRLRSLPAYMTLAVIAVTMICFQQELPAKIRWKFDLTPQQRRIASLPKYQRHIDALNRLPKYRTREYCRKNDCSIDDSIRDGVLRVSFIERAGILDNYTAIVYDPSGFVMRANELKSDLSTTGDYQLFRVKRLFGGDLFWAEPLGENWYRCGFTQPALLSLTYWRRYYRALFAGAGAAKSNPSTDLGRGCSGSSGTAS